jgi:hypothetical protein
LTSECYTWRDIGVHSSIVAGPMILVYQEGGEQLYEQIMLTVEIVAQ